MTTALASLLTGRAVKPTVGMTGEVTLQGRVLPIGGLKQKVLAAHRAGLKEVILPKRNEGDLDDVPEQVRDEMTFHPVSKLTSFVPRPGNIRGGWRVLRSGIGDEGLPTSPNRTRGGPCGPPLRRSAAVPSASQGSMTSRV